MEKLKSPYVLLIGAAIALTVVTLASSYLFQSPAQREFNRCVRELREASGFNLPTEQAERECAQ